MRGYPRFDRADVSEVPGFHSVWAATALVGAADEGALDVDEVAFASAFGPQRRAEWVAGRVALRAAFRAAGCALAGPVLAEPRGGPALPPGWTGSITHKASVAIAVAGPTMGRTLGVDTELEGRSRTEIVTKVLRPAEITRWEAGGRRWVDLLEIFSLKEAIYKALHPFAPRYIGFDEAEVEGDDIRLHLLHGERARILRFARRWDGDRLLSIVEAG
jgi:4'-phosphopantetheinyl transferase EntD